MGMFEGFMPPSGRDGIKVIKCDFLESGVITLATHIVSSLSSSRREGDKGEVSRGMLSIHEIGGADLIGVVGAFHAEMMLYETSDSSTDARF